MKWDDSTCCTTGMSTGKMPTLEELSSIVGQFRAKDNVRKSRAYFDILGMEPCRHCGYKCEYLEGPPETFKVCRCMEAELRRQSVGSVPMAMTQPDRICGIVVEVLD